MVSGAAERGTAERGAAERGAAERGTAERGTARNLTERGTAERGAAERGAAERGAAERGAAERGAAERGTARNLTRDAVLAADLEIAAGLWGKFMGLMGRANLPVGAGLWLPDSNGIHMMFMRFAIDAVFVGKRDAEGTRPVLSIHERLPAWRGLVPLVRGAHGVLELPVGTIRSSGTVVGDRIAIDER